MNHTINSKNLDSTIHRLRVRTNGSAVLLGLVIGFSLFLSGCGQQGSTDPLLGEFTFDVPIAYVKRPVDALITEQEPGNANPRNASQYKPGPTGEGGGNLFIREFASNTAQEYNITAALTAPQYDTDGNLIQEAGDVADPDVNYKGTKIVFSFRKGDPPNTDADMQSKWDLWEYDMEDADGKRIADITNGELRPVMDDLKAKIGNDLDPTYLPDDSIVFTSDRVVAKAGLLQTYTGEDIEEAPLLDESRNEPAVNLHIMFSGDGTSIRQISFNQSHELDPALLSTGKIVYSRWEHSSRDDSESPFPLFQVSPDGSGSDVLYGAHSFADTANDVAAFLQAREAQDGSIIATQMPRNDAYLSGDLVKIDYKNFIDVNTARANASGKGTEGHISITNVSPLGGYSSEGRFATPFPLWDDTNRILVAWAFCEVQDQNGNRELCSLVDNPTNADVYSPAPPGFGIWMLQENGRTMDPIVLPEQGWSITDPIALVDRISLGHYPNVGYPDTAVVPEACQKDASLCVQDNPFGLVKIASVYDSDNLARLHLSNANNLNAAPLDLPALTCDVACNTPGARVSLRTLQEASPDQRPVRFVRIVGAGLQIDGRQSPVDIRDILGYHQVEPDGSVVMRVPANRPFAIELVDKLGRKFHRHSGSWLQVAAGETMTCTGCHAGHSQTTPLNPGAQSAASFPGADLNAPTPNAGETMAETLDRVSCDDGITFDVNGDGNIDVIGDAVDGALEDPPTSGTGCLYRRLSGDLIFRDVWNNPTMAMDPNHTDYAVRYSSLNLGLVQVQIPEDQKQYVRFPVMDAGRASQADFRDPGDCITKWSQNTCRIAINYASSTDPTYTALPRVTHIQSIWEKSRSLNLGEVDGIGNPIVNYPCIRCHREYNRTSALNTTDPQDFDIPDGQLNLTLTGQHQVRIDNTNRAESYRELTENDGILMILNEGQADASFTYVTVLDNTVVPPVENLVGLDQCAEFIDLTAKPGKCGRGHPVSQSDNNRNDGFFIEKMTTNMAGETVDHTQMLDPAELKMIIEWIDLGARYYGDPADQRDNR